MSRAWEAQGSLLKENLRKERGEYQFPPRVRLVLAMKIVAKVEINTLWQHHRINQVQWRLLFCQHLPLPEKQTLINLTTQNLIKHLCLLTPCQTSSLTLMKIWVKFRHKLIMGKQVVNQKEGENILRNQQ